VIAGKLNLSFEYQLMHYYLKVLFLSLLLSTFALAERYNGTYEMYGTINDKYGIEMKVNVDEGNIYGSYKYDTESGRLTLNGTIDQAGNVVLYESDNKGNRTGVFRGKMVYGHATAIDGTWSTPNGKTRFTFGVSTPTEGCSQ
jgi:hypothetical protein